MSETLIIVALIVVLVIIFYLLIRNSSQRLKNMSTAIHTEAKNKGLKIKNMISPSFKEWKNSPFERSTSGLDVPYNKPFYRIVTCEDATSSAEKVFWIRVSRSRTGALTLEWKEKNH